MCILILLWIQFKIKKNIAPNDKFNSWQFGKSAIVELKQRNILKSSRVVIHSGLLS